MHYTIAQCLDERPEAQDENQIAYRQCAREVYETINPMTLAERIAYAQSESPETFEIAAFLDLGVFISFYMPELIKLPFGVHHPQFFNLIPRGQPRRQNQRRTLSNVTADRLGVKGAREAIQRWAKAAGIEGAISGQSLRIGSALSLAEAGASVKEMQRAGRWQDPAMPARYVREAPPEQSPVEKYKDGK